MKGVVVVSATPFFFERMCNIMTLDEIKTQILSVSDVETQIDWDGISLYPILDEDFIRQYFDFLNIPTVLKYNQVSEQFITDYMVDLGLKVFQYQNPSETYLKDLAESDYTIIPDIIFTFGDKVADTFKTHCKNIITYYQDQDDYDVVISEFWFAINNTICSQSFIETNYVKFDINEYLRRFNYNFTLDETFLDTHFSDIDPITLLKSRKLSETFITNHLTTFTDEANYKNIKRTLLRSQDLSVSFIETTLLTNGFDINEIVQFCPLTQAFVQSHISSIDLKLLNKETCKVIDESFILANVNDVDLHNMLSVVNRPCSFLDTLISTIPINPRVGDDISKTNTLTEAFTKKHIYPLFKIHHGEILDLPHILLYNSFPETFIDEIKDHEDMDWQVVLEHQTLSSTFIIDHLEYITPFLEKSLFYQPCMDQPTLEAIMDELKYTSAQRGRMYAIAMKYIHISRLTINAYISYMTPLNISRYQIYDPDLYYTSNTYAKNRIRSIMFERDVRVMDPCQKGIDWYQSHWGLTDEVDYNDILIAVKSDKKFWYLDWFFKRGEKLFGSHPCANFIKP